MTAKEFNKTIEDLRDDANYFGELGSRYLSNSDIVTLHNTPDLYGVGLEESLPLLEGTYLHKRILEPETLSDMIISDAKTRRNKEYTELVQEHQVEEQPKPVFLLKGEVQRLEMLASKIESNPEFVDALQAHVKPNEIEEPMIGQLFGYWFKGKADRINKSRGFIADLKTTRSLSSFRQNFRTYGYHSQAYIYDKLFGMPVRFYVIDKTDGRLAVVDVKEETLEDAERYVKWGLEKLEFYYGENGEQALSEYYDYFKL